MSNRLPDPVLTSIEFIDISKEESAKRRKDFVNAVASIIISGLEIQENKEDDHDKEKRYN